MDAKRLENFSIEDYIKLEQETDTRYEFHDGVLFAMAGGTLEHGLISGNAYGEIKFGLRNKGKNCTAINNDVKLHITSANKFLYPDVMVICGEIERSEVETNAVVNPVLIVEVLSKSTESYDRGDKFFAYKQIETLQEHILIDQYSAQVDMYQRKSNFWEITRIEGINEELHITSLDLNLSLENLYEGIVFVK